MHWLKWFIAALVLLDAGWFVFDGVHALTRGDYVTPKSGPYAGQLGPWSKVVAAVGIEPRSTAMKRIFVGYGAVWLAITVCFLAGMGWAWWGMLLAALGALWYLPFGTMLSVLQVILLLLPQVRGSAAA
jgi:hypothetical protein